jgi:hypothetical protein
MTSRAQQSEIQIACSDFACGHLSSQCNIESSHDFNMDAAMQHNTANGKHDLIRCVL